MEFVALCVIFVSITYYILLGKEQRNINNRNKCCIKFMKYNIIIQAVIQ